MLYYIEKEHAHTIISCLPENSRSFKLHKEINDIALIPYVYTNIDFLQESRRVFFHKKKEISLKSQAHIQYKYKLRECFTISFLVVL